MRLKWHIRLRMMVPVYDPPWQALLPVIGKSIVGVKANLVMGWC